MAIAILAATEKDIADARNWAGFFRSRGLNVFPSRPDEKRPFVRYAEHWESPAPADLFDRFPTPNIQVMTGRRWKLLVIDLDGPESRAWFYAKGAVPRTWATHSGGDGLHLWFSIPSKLPRALPKAFLWKGDGNHSAVERLCDRSLIVAPPSIHPKTGKQYRFASKAQSPLSMPFPAPCPRWVLELPPLAPPSRPVVPVAAPRERIVVKGGAKRYRISDVLDAIPDKVAMAESWGLRVAVRTPNVSGWCQCHAVGREDRTPSASISAESGRYWEPGGKTIGLFELGVRLGVYSDWRDAVQDVGDRFHAREAV